MCELNDLVECFNENLCKAFSYKQNEEKAANDDKEILFLSLYINLFVVIILMISRIVSAIVLYNFQVPAIFGNLLEILN